MSLADIHLRQTSNTHRHAQPEQKSNTFNLLEAVSNERWNLWGWTGGDISRWQMSYREVRRDTTLQGSLINEAQWTVVYTVNLTTRLVNLHIT